MNDINSICNKIWNECDELREGAAEGNGNAQWQIDDAIEQLDRLANALFIGAIDFDETWREMFEDCVVDLVYEGQHENVLVLCEDVDNSSTITLIIGNEACQFERGADGWYEINDAQSMYSIFGGAEEIR